MSKSRMNHREDKRFVSRRCINRECGGARKTLISNQDKQTESHIILDKVQLERKSRLEYSPAYLQQQRRRPRDWIHVLVKVLIVLGTLDVEVESMCIQHQHNQIIIECAI